MAKAKDNGAETAAAQPQLSVLAQYVKDLSFENPNAPESLRPKTGQPQINIQVNVNAKSLTENDYEVDLVIEAKAEADNSVLFNVELAYAGVFRIQGVTKDAVHPVVMIECPRLLFPFARQVVADASQRGGFPPLMIDPFDFAALYRQRMAEVQAKETSDS